MIEYRILLIYQPHSLSAILTNQLYYLFICISICFSIHNRTVLSWKYPFLHSIALHYPFPDHNLVKELEKKGENETKLLEKKAISSSPILSPHQSLLLFTPLLVRSVRGGEEREERGHLRGIYKHTLHSIQYHSLSDNHRVKGMRV